MNKKEFEKFKEIFHKFHVNPNLTDIVSLYKNI